MRHKCIFQFLIEENLLKISQQLFMPHIVLQIRDTFLRVCFFLKVDEET